MIVMKPGKVKTTTKFPSLDNLFESPDTPYLYNLEEYIIRTGIFDQICDDFEKGELKLMDLMKIERQKEKEHGELVERWRPVLEEESRVSRGLPMKYMWLDLDEQIKSSKLEFDQHYEKFEFKKNEAKSRWEKFIEKFRRLYKTEIVDAYLEKGSFDSYFIHVPKVKGSRCECTDNISSRQSSSFSIEFFGIGGGGVTEISREEGLVTTIENGECCKIEITVEFLVQLYRLYRMGKLKKEGAWAKPKRMIAIAPVTINPNEDTCGWPIDYVNSQKNIKHTNVDTSKFKSGLIKRTLKIREELQSKGGISLKLPGGGIEIKVEFVITNTSTKDFIYTLPKGYIYTYYTVPNTIGYSWAVQD